MFGPRLGRLAMRAALGGSATAAGLSAVRAASAQAAPAPPPAAADLPIGALFRLDGRVALVTGASRG